MNPNAIPSDKINFIDYLSNKGLFNEHKYYTEMKHSMWGNLSQTYESMLQNDNSTSSINQLLWINTM